jgi:hypothetical protein
MSETPTTECFRFIALRHPRKAMVSPADPGFVTYEPVLLKLDSLPRGVLLPPGGGRGQTLYTTFVSLLGISGARTLIESAARNYQENDPRHIDSVTELYERFPGFQWVNEFLERNRNEPLAEQIQARIGKELGIPIDEYVKDPAFSERSLTLWDNLFSLTVLPSKTQLRHEILTVIRLLQLIERLHDNDPALRVDEGVRRAVTATVLLPAPLFPLPAAPPPPPGPSPATSLALTSSLGLSAYSAPGTQPIVALGGSLIALSSLCAELPLRDPCTPYQGPPLPHSAGTVKPLGVGDLLVVRNQLVKYEAGEIAHIENVMASEKRERTHRRLLRTEETFTQETEITQETERDTQTTERFSLERETEQVVKSDASFKAGVALTAKYGPVELTAKADYATSNSQSESTKVAVQYAKEVTDRASVKVTQRVREQRTRTTIDEIEETNLHSFNNATLEHVIGTYHWVDKIYQSQLFNYGKRLMFEFIVPEPAAFHIYSQANNGAEGQLLEKPIPPDAPGQSIGRLLSFQDLTLANYGIWAARYGTRDISAPPAQFQTVSASYNHDQDNGYPTRSASITLPEGYTAEVAFVRYGYSPGGDPPNYLRFFVGKKQFGSLSAADADNFSLPMDKETGALPVSIQSYGTYYFINVEIQCQLLPEKLDDWRIKTYQAIVAAYETRKAAYDNQVESLGTQSGASLRSLSPERNREIEQQELKKSCLEIFTAQRFEAFDAMRNRQPSEGYPEFDFTEAATQGKYIQFFEQAFEWEQITYLFYDYFWGRKPNWVTVRQYQDDDPLFTRFLQAGAARVLVPVHPAYTQTVLYFLISDGEIWSGGDAPILSDDLYISLAEEVKAADLQDAAGVAQGDPWTVRVPTSLVTLKTATPPALPDHAAELLPR